MENYKPKVRYLTEEQATILNNLGFYRDGFNNQEKVDKNYSSFQKSYDVCGGRFRLMINFERCNFCGTEIYPYVKMKSPYDSWWSQYWNISEFMKELDKFNDDIKMDIGVLIGLDLIEVSEEIIPEEDSEEE